MDNGLQILYTPAHTKEREGETTEDKHRIGNDWADFGAKRGRDLHVVDADTVGAYKDARDKVTDYVRWMGEAAWAQGKGGQARDSRAREKANPEVLLRKEARTRPSTN